MDDRFRLLALELMTASPRIASVAARALDADRWRALDALAAPHRLRPMLHARFGSADAGAPTDVRDLWSTSHRQALLLAMRQAAALSRMGTVLSAGLGRATILKGGALPWDNPSGRAIRPMRDLDLLVHEEDAAGHQAALLEAGYRMEGERNASGGKHLPTLIDADGVRVELHTRVIAMCGRADLVDEGVLRRALLADAVPPTGPLASINRLATTSPTGTLLHILVHGVRDHRLNNGPLTIHDVAGLTMGPGIDWGRLWNVACASGNVRYVQLGLVLALRFRPELPVEWCGRAPAGLAPSLVDRAALMMLAGCDERTGLGGLGRAVASSPRKVADRLRRGVGDFVTSPPARLAAGRRVRTIVRTGMDAGGRARLADARRIDDWLRGGGGG